MDVRHPNADGTPRTRTGFADALLAVLPDAAHASSLRASGAAVVALFDPVDWRSFLDDAAVVVDAQEAARAARQRNPRRRDDLLLAYALHRLLLAWLMGCEPAHVPLGRDAKGCPRLAGDRLYTSLSHADGGVAIAACPRGPVGIDIEPEARSAVMDELMDHVAHPDERDRIVRMPATARGRALLELWVRKEALLKAAGIGLEREMSTFDAPLGVDLSLPGDTFRGHAVELRMLDAGAGWTMALAAPPGSRVVEVTNR